MERVMAVMVCSHSSSEVSRRAAYSAPVNKHLGKIYTIYIVHCYIDCKICIWKQQTTLESPALNRNGSVLIVGFWEADPVAEDKRRREIDIAGGLFLLMRFIWRRAHAFTLVVLDSV
jgi:hypothetical protein